MGGTPTKVYKALEQAIREGNTNAAVAILDKNEIDPCKHVDDMFYILEEAARYGQVEVIERMLKRKHFKLKKEVLDGSLLASCAKATKAAVVRLLVDARADINTVDMKLNTPLMLCCCKDEKTDKALLVERRKAAAILIDNGADLRTKNFDEMNALLLACKNEHEKMAHLLVDKGADVMDVSRWVSKNKDQQTNWVAGSILKQHAFENPDFVDKLRQQWMKAFDPDGSGELNRDELILFIAANVTMAFKAGMKPTTKFEYDENMDVRQVATQLEKKCPELIKAYTKHLDKDKDGTYTWQELIPIVKTFYGNLWTSKRPKIVDEGNEEADTGAKERMAPDLDEDADRKIRVNQVAPSPSPVPLPPNWSEVPNPNKSGEHDAVYYWNTSTGETSWHIVYCTNMPSPHEWSDLLLHRR